MVRIIAVHQREGEKGSFMSLELQGDIELIQSQNSGRFYATVRRCFISSTFDEATAQSLVGTKLKGSIVRIACEPYEFTIPESGEVVTLAYSWDYRPEEVQENQGVLNPVSQYQPI